MSAILLLLALLNSGPLPERATATPASSRLAKPGVCEREGGFGQRKTPRRANRLHPPKKTHDVHPRFPKQPPNSRAVATWMGEFLVDEKGTVKKVWSLREVWEPPFPAFNRAIEEAIQQWRFEPTIVDGVAVPVCATMSMSINWQ